MFVQINILTTFEIWMRWWEIDTDINAHIRTHITEFYMLILIFAYRSKFVNAKNNSSTKKCLKLSVLEASSVLVTDVINLIMWTAEYQCWQVTLLCFILNSFLIDHSWTPKENWIIFSFILFGIIVPVVTFIESYISLVHT